MRTGTSALRKQLDYSKHLIKFADKACTTHIPIVRVIYSIYTIIVTAEICTAHILVGRRWHSANQETATSYSQSIYYEINGSVGSLILQRNDSTHHETLKKLSSRACEGSLLHSEIIVYKTYFNLPNSASAKI